MSTPALQTMSHHLTTPFARGASTLALTLSANTDTTQAQVAPYDFSEYFSLFNALPRPCYVLIALQDVTQDTQLTIDYQGTSLSGNTVITIAAGTQAGASFALDLAGHEEPDIRLLRIHMASASNQQLADIWGIQALLGNVARLLWVIGWEKDAIRRHLEIVQTQRHLPKAVRYSLDLLGYDLGIPRFPPQPYSFDTATIALYHLNDLPASGQPEVSKVEDSTDLYTSTSHPGQNTSARSGAVGRFGSAFAFANTEIQVSDHADFNPSAQGSFTVECFVKPDPLMTDGEVIAKHPKPVANTTTAGWAVSIGNFQRGLPFNVRFLLSDGVIPAPILLFADSSLSSDRFYHIACVLDRGSREARLYIDGNLTSKQSISGLGAVSNTEPVHIGRSPVAAYQGIIDEVRFSRVARSSFHPVLGEDDEVYRRRLELFGRWTLPTTSNLQKMLNDAVSTIEGGISGDPQSIVLNELNADMAGSTVEFTVQPNVVAAGMSIDGQGNMRVQETDINGTAELDFDPIYLVTHNDPRVTYALSEARILARGETPASSSKMQLVTTGPLGRLLDLLGTSGNLLTILSAFDPRADDLRSVGRGLLLAPTTNTLSLAQLAALAHRAGFSFVSNRNDLRAVYVSVAAGDYLGIVVNAGGTAQSANGFTLHAGETLNLSVQPTLPPDTLYRWITLPANQGTFSPTNDRSSVMFTAGTTGILNIKVDSLRRQHIASGTMTLQVGPADLADGASIGTDGTQGVDVSSAGMPDDAFFHPAYLITHNDARVTYGNDINTRRMQLSVGQHLDQLLSLLTNNAVGSQLQLVQAYTPGTGDLFQVGRAITIQHPTLAPGRLGVMAHAAGFTYVHRQGNQILLRQQADDLVVIQKLVGSSLTPVPVTTPQEIIQQQTINLEVSPRAVPHGIAVGTNFIYVANSGTDTVSEINPATGLVRRALKVGWGPVAIVLSPDGTRLYTADNLGGSVTALDLASGNTLKIIPARPGPVALAHHPTNQRLYVICQADNSLLEIDTGVLTVLNTPLAVGISPTGIALTPDGATIWVTLNGANQINIVSTISPLALVSTIALTKAPLKIALSPDGTRAYVTQPLDGSIVFLNVANRSVVMTISTGASGTSNPSAIAVALDNSAIYVTDTTIKNERLLLLKPVDGSIIAAIRIQQEPLDLAGAVTSIDATIGKQQYIMVASRDGDIVSVIDPLKMHIANTWRIGSGLGEVLNWILRMPPTTGAHLSNASAPVVNLTGDSVGPGLVRAVYAQRNNPNNTAPYTFDVRLKPTLENASTTIIRKEQYDLIMNILNAFHPVGVEVTTRTIRDRVIEVKGQLRNAFPDYTYPNFRVRGPLPHSVRKD